ncbi:hypothetical protein [Streptantibioticus silvisoli]|uniref:Uncharacterized protein n=1 Tax=Streptantibioticus silvisoli TaxID=2705255 RepID=A0ABT6W8R9_9ACTN|nr:hypothetical protein [Streptantibioticus silvisoli]MDI5967154.1 hypothetical protein [Streptantibioticus silvisoli]
MNLDAAPATDHRVTPALPGTAWTIHPVTGERRLDYAPPVPDTTAAVPPPIPTAPDVWPRRLGAGGISTAAVIAAIGYAGPGLSQAGHAVEMGGIGVGVAAGALGALTLLVKGSLGSKAGQQHVEVNVNVTNTSSAGGRSGRKRW